MYAALPSTDGHKMEATRKERACRFAGAHGHSHSSISVRVVLPDLAVLRHRGRSPRAYFLRKIRRGDSSRATSVASRRPSWRGDRHVALADGLWASATAPEQSPQRILIRPYAVFRSPSWRIYRVVSGAASSAWPGGAHLMGESFSPRSSSGRGEDRQAPPRDVLGRAVLSDAVLGPRLRGVRPAPAGLGYTPRGVQRVGGPVSHLSDGFQPPRRDSRGGRLSSIRFTAKSWMRSSAPRFAQKRAAEGSGRESEISSRHRRGGSRTRALGDSAGLVSASRGGPRNHEVVGYVGIFAAMQGCLPALRVA
jgi:hypothetical protein